MTESAANGLEALERVAASPPDLVLLDVMMPELDGIATLRILKQDPETRLIPVVLMTALNAVEDRVRGIEAGADDFLSKPVDDRELLARIRTAISRKRAIDDTVGELRRTSAHLERFGRQARDVAILAVEWRLDDGGPRRRGRLRRAPPTRLAEQLIGELGGQLSETGPDDTVLIAVFDGTDVRSPRDEGGRGRPHGRRGDRPKGSGRRTLARPCRCRDRGGSGTGRLEAARRPWRWRMDVGRGGCAGRGREPGSPAA